jgi:phospholipid/cholesterol/gamma-HCH transport system substrate-binding protein
VRFLRLAAAGLVAALVASGCSLPGADKGPLELTAVFDDVGDLVVNHSVQVADVRVGSVTSIELTDDYHARITMRIKDGLNLPADAVAVLRTTSLLGEKFIELRPRHEGDSCPDGPPAGGVLADGDTVTCTQQAPELEFVAEQAVELLGGVASNDLQTLVETGAVGFGGRGEELRGLIDDLATLSSTLADQTDNIVSVIDGLDRATTQLAAGAPDLDQLLVNLSQTTTLLADNREQAITTLQSLTRLARTQNQLVFEPYLAQTSTQIQQVDAILNEITASRDEVGSLLDWVNQFVLKAPLAIPCRQRASDGVCDTDAAQVYGWFVVPSLQDGG